MTTSTQLVAPLLKLLLRQAAPAGSAAAPPGIRCGRSLVLN
jgi:hypothetical protein